LEETKEFLNKINVPISAPADDTSSNDFPTSLLVVGVVSLIGLFFFVLIKSARKNKLKKK